VLVDGEVELGPVTEPWDLGMMPRPDDPPLRILMLHKADRISEAGEARSPKQKADLTRLKTEMIKAGVLGWSETLQPSSKGRRQSPRASGRPTQRRRRGGLTPLVHFSASSTARSTSCSCFRPACSTSRSTLSGVTALDGSL
jgi:hypothetical protein